MRDVCAIFCLIALGCSDADGCDAGDCARMDAQSIDSGARSRDAPPPDSTCASVRLETERTIPNVLLVVDLSGSMNLPFDEGLSRWQVLEDSLLAMPDGLIASLAPAARFGVVMYTEDGKSPCPDLSAQPAAIDNYDGVSAIFAGSSPGGNTPTGQSLEYVLANIETLAPAREEPTVIVLSTDGEPATCEDGTDVENGRRLVVDATEDAFGMDIRTYVISVGDEIADEHLQEVANAGLGVGEGDPDARYWVATDTDGLETALWEIASGVISCEVELQGRIDPDLACQGTVTLGADELACTSDWRANDETHIELLGAACERFRRSSEVLFATFPCGVIII
jgi:hypothetical protein